MKKLFGIIIYPFAIIFYSAISLYSFLTGKQMPKYIRSSSTSSYLTTISQLSSLLKEPFVSPKVNKINPLSLINKLSQKGFKHNYAGSELLLSYLVFRRT